MEKFTAESLADALTYCYGGFGRRVGIMFKTRKDAHDCSRALRQCISDGLIANAKYDNRINEIIFDTGSSVRILSASSEASARGHRFTRVLYDPQIENAELIMRMKTWEIPENGNAFGNMLCSDEHMIANTSEIDEFLSQFCEQN